MKLRIVVVVVIVLLLLAVPGEGQDIAGPDEMDRTIAYSFERNYHFGLEENYDRDYAFVYIPPPMQFPKPEGGFSYDVIERAELILLKVVIVYVRPAQSWDIIQDNESVVMVLESELLNESFTTEIEEDDVFLFGNVLNESLNIYWEEDLSLSLGTVDIWLYRYVNESEWYSPLDIWISIFQVWEVDWHSWMWVCGGVVENTDHFGDTDLFFADISNPMTWFWVACLGFVLVIVKTDTWKKKRYLNTIRMNLTSPYSMLIYEESEG